MGKRNRQQRRAAGLKTHETELERAERIGREQRAHWEKVNNEVFQPQRDSLPDVSDLPTSEPQRPKLYRLAGFAARMRRNNDGA